MLEMIPSTFEDETFLLEVYTSSRAQEFNSLGWNIDELKAFMGMQYQFQQKSYSLQFPQALHQIILQNEQRAGSLVVDRSDALIRLVDICLLPEYQNQGIGTQILKQLQTEAITNSKIIKLSVVVTNPALALYKRLGFEMIEKAEVYCSMEWKN